MGGYALYVWGSFGLTVAVVAGEILLARNRRQRILQELRDTMESEESKI